MIENIRVKAGWSSGEFCDAFSHRVAHEYAAYRLSFSTADAALNRLHTFFYLRYDSLLPAYSWEVFEAFDEGEYQHDGDADDVNPEDKYTRPQILNIIASNKAPNL